MLDGDAAGGYVRRAHLSVAPPYVGFFWSFSCRNKKRANNLQNDKLKFELQTRNTLQRMLEGVNITERNVTERS